jgi:hypothetical protein
MCGVTVRVPFSLKRVRQTNNGTHYRLLATWGRSYHLIGALKIGGQDPEFWSHLRIKGERDEQTHSYALEV